MSSQTIQYNFNIVGNANEVISAISQSSMALNENMSQTLNVFQGLKGTAVGLQGFVSVVQNMQNAIGGITQAGANAELQLINMKTLFGGNAEAAKEMYDRISEYGKVTPYDKAGLIQAQSTMMSFGMEGEKAFETLRQIGDIAMGDSGKMQSLALAFAQMSSAGKLSGQDLMQMINAGFNPLNEISKLTGKSLGELKDEMSRGAISTDMVAAAFRSATSEGGLFYGAIEAASNTTAGKMASIEDSINEVKVSIAGFFGDFGLWVDAVAKVAVPIAELLPLFEGAWTLMDKIKGLQWAGMWEGVRKKVLGNLIGLQLYNRQMALGVVVSGGFWGNMLQATWAVVRFATVGVMQALKGIGALILSFVTGGATSAAFATTATVSFSAFKLSAVTACRAVGVAIMSIPIIGWIAAAVAALVAIGVYFWNTSAKFRAVLKGLWASFKAFFSGLGDLAKGTFGAIGDLIKAAFRLDPKGINAAMQKLKSTYSDFGANIGKSFNEAYTAEMKAAKEKKEEEEKTQTVDPATVQSPAVTSPPAAPLSPTGGTLSAVGSGAASGSGRISHVTVNVERLVERFEIHTTNLQNDAARIKDMVSEALLSALNDVNLAV